MIAAVTRCYENFRANSTSRIRVIETSLQKSSQESGARLARALRPARTVMQCSLFMKIISVIEWRYSASTHTNRGSVLSQMYIPWGKPWISVRDDLGRKIRGLKSPPGK